GGADARWHRWHRWHRAAPPAGLEPAHTAPEADALSAELRGREVGGYRDVASTGPAGGGRSAERADDAARERAGAGAPFLDDGAAQDRGAVPAGGTAQARPALG